MATFCMWFIVDVCMPMNADSFSDVPLLDWYLLLVDRWSV